MPTTRLKRFILPDPVHKGDKFNIDCDFDTDITGYNIRAEISDSYGTVLKKGSSGVSGGASTQAAITTATEGLFTIYILNNETKFMKGDVSLIIELEDASNNRFTVWSGYLKLTEPNISWDSI